MKEKIGTVVILGVMVIVVPYFITLCVNGCNKAHTSILEGIHSGRDVIICVSGKNKLVDLEEYVAMTLPGLIDYRSDMSLIEAQAVAVRGKIVYEMGGESCINAADLEFTYFTNQDIKDKFGADNLTKAVNRYEEAVYNTKGQIM